MGYTEAVKTNHSVRNVFYNGDFPAAAWIQITRSFSARPDAQIEVELIADLPMTEMNSKYLIVYFLIRPVTSVSGNPSNWHIYSGERN
jgi:hypothetical protein